MLADPERPVAGVLLAQPNFYGVLEPMAEAARLACRWGRSSWPSSSPSRWPSSRRPGAYGADIASGEGQPLEIAPQYGGP